MPIDLKRALGAQLAPAESSWNEQQIILYHLGLGAALQQPTAASELAYVYEKTLKVLPTFAVIPVTGALAGLRTVPGIDINYALVLHGEQEIEVLQPIPGNVSNAVHEARVAAIHDKGKAAVIVVEVVTKLRGEALFINRCSVFARGEGNFGGDPGAGAKLSHEPPQRAADAVVESPTLPNQALLYRLSGDMNPLHAEPEFAKRAGFERPILHGLCSYGIVCKAAVDTLLGGDVAAVARYHGRFTGVVFPGETIVTSLWKEQQTLLISAKTKERATPVLSASISLRT